MTHVVSGARTLSVEVLSRVEGEGGMRVIVDGDVVRDVELRIFEPPRFFEAMLRGRSYTEPPDITARICGICPVAYQISSVQAIEDACGVAVPDDIRALRRLLFCGEWIESHGLHIYLLHAPDFLGYPSAIHLASQDREIVQRGLDMKKVGNDLVDVVGGRAIHPINVRIGGFHRVPRLSELAGMVAPLRRAADQAEETARWVNGFSFPEVERDYEFVALSDPDGRYPIDTGRVVSSTGVDVPVQEFPEHFVEYHVARSTALHSRLAGVASDSDGHYHVGPLARWALNRDRLSPRCLALADELGVPAVVRNPFRSVLVRAIETLYACEEALRILESYAEPAEPAVPVPARAGAGHGVSEAPRGLLYHRYRIDGEGTITDAVITPPTAQNLPTIEDDLRAVIQANLTLDDEALTLLSEHAIRNYDPCISCSTHFLRLTMDRR
ncbi:MAG TPA: Ni/Fe hydrogenase subunit alpha [Kineosporiaceae bacterium]